MTKRNPPQSQWTDLERLAYLLASEALGGARHDAREAEEALERASDAWEAALALPPSSEASTALDAAEEALALASGADRRAKARLARQEQRLQQVYALTCAAH